MDTEASFLPVLSHTYRVVLLYFTRGRSIVTSGVCICYYFDDYNLSHVSTTAHGRPVSPLFDSLVNGCRASGSVDLYVESLVDPKTLEAGHFESCLLSLHICCL